MQKTKSVSELIGGTSKALLHLRERLDERARLLLQVRATLPPQLVAFALSAGLKDGVLTIGTGSAAWASRLRYVTPQTIAQLNADYQLSIEKVKIRVVRAAS